MKGYDSNVLFLKKDIVEISKKDLTELKNLASKSSLKRARFCLHETPEEKVQEMIIAFCKDSFIPIHKHNKGESIYLLEGRLLIVFFDDDGKITKKIFLSTLSDKLPFFYKLNANLWHAVIPLTDFVIIHEVTSGPFKKDANIYDPEWGRSVKDIMTLKKMSKV